MKKELLEAYMRLCTTQTNVFKGNVPKCHVFEVSVQRSTDTPVSFPTSFYINAHCIPNKSQDPILKHWWLSNNDTPERINAVLTEISEYIEFNV